jgi:hypothetical protein
MRTAHHCERLVTNEELTSESLGLLIRKTSGKREAIIDEGYEWILPTRRRCPQCVALSYGSDWTRENDESDDKSDPALRGRRLPAVELVLDGHLFTPYICRY